MLYYNAFAFFSIARNALSNCSPQSQRLEPTHRQLNIQNEYVQEHRYSFVHYP